jgi:hypothetical protein
MVGYKQEGIIMTKKKQLEYLLNAYMREEYAIDTFCDEFVRCFYQLKDDNDIIDEEKLSVLRDIASQCTRYTPYREDLLLSDYFVSDSYMNKKIEEGYHRYFMRDNCNKA